MICVGNITKFFSDHPELENYREEVLARVKKALGKDTLTDDDIVMGGSIDDVLGILTSPFLQDTEGSPEHAEIWLMAEIKMNASQKS
jgi:hypothetical protein